MAKSVSEKVKLNIRDYSLIILSQFLIAIGVYFFKFQNNFSFGGVSGIAVLLSKIHFLTAGDVVFILNAALLLLGFIFLGKNFGVKTVVSSLLMSFFISLLEKSIPLTSPLTNEPMLELAFAIGLPAIGAAILFNIGASGGGTDIIALILQKYTSINIGKALFFTDLLITLTVFIVYDLKTGLFSFLGLMIKSLAIDSMIESINLCKYFNIICTDPDPICDFIVNKLHRGATICEAQGAFSHTNKYIILTALKRGQAVRLRTYIRQVEPSAFIMISNTSEIIGKGFRK